MNAKTIAAGGLTAGLLLGAWGALQPEDLPPARSDLGALTSAEPFVGIISTEESVEFWQARVEARPDGFLDRTQLGIALAGLARETADLARYEESEAVLRDALRANPQSTTTKLALGQTLHSQHRFTAARDLAHEVWLAESTSPGAVALLGDASFELGDYAEAEQHYRDLAAQERSAPVVSRLSRLAYATGQPDLALGLAEEALALSEELTLRPPDRAFYHFQLGHVRFATGNVDAAIEALETALDIAPDHPGARERLAFVYASTGRTADAEMLYRALLESGPAADLHGSYADLLRARGAVVEADRQEALGLELARATIDRFPAERRHLATFFMTRDATTAVELAAADLAERSDVGAFDTMAWALFHAGRVAEADEMIARALSIGTRDAALSYHAGAIAAANGDPERAVRHLHDALAINPTFHPTEASFAAALLAELER